MKRPASTKKPATAGVDSGSGVDGRACEDGEDERAAQILMEIIANDLKDGDPDASMQAATFAMMLQSQQKEAGKTEPKIPEALLNNIRTRFPFLSTVNDPAKRAAYMEGLMNGMEWGFEFSSACSSMGSTTQNDGDPANATQNDQDEQEEAFIHCPE